MSLILNEIKSMILDSLNNFATVNSDYDFDFDYGRVLTRQSEE
jgi:hypothetical protein